MTISADSYYNPFGVEFGPNGTAFRTRFTSLGQRAAFNNTNTDQVVAGLEGFLGETWKWDFAMNYGHQSLLTKTNGYVLRRPGRCAGPVVPDPATGVVTCGTPTALIANCTPVNIFNIEDPATIATYQVQRQPLRFDPVRVQGLRGQRLGRAVPDAGRKPRSWRSARSGATNTSAAKSSTWPYQPGRDLPDLAGSLQLAGRRLTASELYGELFLLLLKDAPFAKALNVTLGTRYSDYDLSATTPVPSCRWNGVRSTTCCCAALVAEVFRAPGA
ncbi:MAG: hypothetical protein U1F20_01180 [Lysobacterales bacterium]